MSAEPVSLGDAGVLDLTPPHSPSQLGVVLRVVEAGFEHVGRQIQDVRADVATQMREVRDNIGNLREDMGRMSGRVDSLFTTVTAVASAKTAEKVANVAVQASGQAAGVAAQAAGKKFLQGMWEAVPWKAKLGAIALSLLGLGHGSAYVIPGCGKTIHIHDTAAVMLAGSPTPGIRSSLPAWAGPLYLAAPPVPASAPPPGGKAKPIRH